MRRRNPGSSRLYPNIHGIAQQRNGGPSLGHPKPLGAAVVLGHPKPVALTCQDFCACRTRRPYPGGIHQSPTRMRPTGLKTASAWPTGFMRGPAFSARVRPRVASPSAAATAPTRRPRPRHRRTATGRTRPGNRRVRPSCRISSAGPLNRRERGGVNSRRLFPLVVGPISHCAHVGINTVDYTPKAYTPHRRSSICPSGRLRSPRTHTQATPTGRAPETAALRGQKVRGASDGLLQAPVNPSAPNRDPAR